ncbi:MAG: hypothetical protein KL787_03605 [Taibaiella sp.]|nr:hypothetical protein [Taibaiella sp.]
MRYLTYSLICCICYSFYFIGCNANQESLQNKDTIASPSVKDTLQIKRGKDWGFRINDAYPKIIDSLQLRELYDSTKWYLYLLHCGETPKMINTYDGTKTPLNFTFSELDLRFDTLEVSNETVKIYFWFYVNDTTVLNLDYFSYYLGDTISSKDDNYYRLEEYINGRMYYNSKNLDICYLTKGSTIGYFCISSWFNGRETIDSMLNRRVNPLQPEVIKYINEHKRELHPWFYREAVKRGVIKEE